MEELQTLQINGQKMAILPFQTYERLIEVMEDAEDIGYARAVQDRIISGEETYPASLVDELTNPDNSPVKVFRKYRGLTQKELAEKVGVSLAQIKKIEGKDSDGSIKTLKKIAKVLNVEPGELL